MKAFLFTVTLLSSPFVCAAEASPVNKVVQLLSDLELKIKAESSEAKELHEEFSMWCKEQSKDLAFSVDTDQEDVNDLKANLQQLNAESAVLRSKIEDLASSSAASEVDLKSATDIRDEEHVAFLAAEKELLEIIDTLERVVSILERELKGGASMIQLQHAGSVVQALRVLVQASAINSADASRLTALFQSSQKSEDADEMDALGAPSAAVYESHSGSIVETLQDLQQQAEAELDDIRGEEMGARHHFELLKQSLEDEMQFGAEDLAEAKKSVAERDAQIAADKADLEVTTRDLDQDTSALAETKRDCETKAAQYEAAVNSRAEELEALAKAKQVLTEKIGGAESLSYGLSQTSFLQFSRSWLSSRSDLEKFEAVRKIRDLAKTLNSLELAQLGSRLTSAMHAQTTNGEDPFAKVKGLIVDMIARLEEKASADASHKAYCDKELAQSKSKKESKSAEIAKLTSKIDTTSARSAQLKREVAALQTSLGDLAAAQAAMTKFRAEEKDAFETNKKDLEEGIAGVRSALNILREYYGAEHTAHETANGEAGGIVGLLEVIESDFSKNLAEITSTEEQAAAAYDKQSKENEVETVSKGQDVKYKTKEAAALDRALSEWTSDRTSVQSEHDAVHSYLSELEKQCLVAPETYAQRTSHREAEIAGLKEALSLLGGEALVQEKTSRTFLRRVARHPA
jgi:predicted  nucleic acid-binding Zn-ribbon protein